MALAFDAVSSAEDSNVSSLSWSHTCTGSDLALNVGGVARDATAGDAVISGITYNGVALTNIDVAGTTRRSEMWELKNPATGSNTVTITYTGTCERVGGSAISHTGADQSTQPDASNTNTGNDDTPTVDVTTIADDTIVVDCVFFNNVGASVGADQTQRTNLTIDVDRSILMSTEPKATAGSVTMSWSGPSAIWSTVSASIKPAVAAVATSNFFQVF